jgi:MYXO-CTERM domain-containing protein
VNNFQARYAIRHEWTGPIACKNPVRGRWGGPPSGVTGGGVKPALDLAFAPRGSAKLAELVRGDIPELEIKVAAAPPQTGPRPGSSVSTTPPTPPAKRKSGCGCSSSPNAPLGLGLSGLVFATLIRRRRHR